MNANCANPCKKLKDAPTLVKAKTPKATLLNSRSKTGRADFGKPRVEFKTPTSAQKSYKLHNCQGILHETPVGRKTAIPILKRKSVSLVELPVEDPNRSKPFGSKRIYKEFGDESKLPKRAKGIKNHIPPFRSFDESVIARKVLLRFTTHAWRKQGAQVKALQTHNRELKNKVENLNVQTLFLKELLAGESERAQRETNESASLKIKLENALKTNENLKTKLKLIEDENNNLKSKNFQLDVENNQLQEMLNKAETLSLDTRNLLLAYYKEQEDSKEKQSQLTEKLKNTHESLENSRNELITMEQICIEYRIQVETLSTQNNKLREQDECKRKLLDECTNAMQNLETEHSTLKTVNKEQNTCIDKLTKNYEDAQAQIIEQSRRIEDLVEIIKLYEAEKDYLEHKFKNVATGALGLTLKLIPISNFLPF